MEAKRFATHSSGAALAASGHDMATFDEAGRTFSGHAFSGHALSGHTFSGGCTPTFWAEISFFQQAGDG
jgi:hypothetical protein